MTSEVVDGSAVPTLEAVAAHAGVSRSTVSRVVNGSPSVTADVVAAVQRAIEELNYVPNRAARSLASRRTQVIALVIPESTEGILPHVGSRDVKSMSINAGHVGLVVSSKAQKEYWPEATRWIADRSTSL